MRTLLSLCLVAILVACSPCGEPAGDIRDGDAPDIRAMPDLGRDAEAPPDLAEELPAPAFLWPGDSPQPDWSPWFDQHPWVMDEFSHWSYQVATGSEPPHFRYLPDHAVANGHVFTLLGYTYPLNTLHSMNGPYYHKGARFFSDVWVELSVGVAGAPLAWQQQGSGKLTTFPFAVTWAKAPQATLITTDFAPLVGTEKAVERRALVRLAIVHNPGSKPIKGLVLAVRTAGPQSTEGNRLVEQVENRTRTLAILDEKSVLSDGYLRLELPEIGPGEDRVVPVVMVFDDEQNLLEETLQALATAGWETLLSQTRVAWSERLAPAARLTTPDQRVNDYLASQLLVILSQQAHNGSSHPMCEYTRTWLRDNAGPARLLTRIGLFETLRAQLDYLHLAALVGGNISNSYDGFFTPDDAGPEPDWANMPTITGRSRAESPSYIPLMFSWYREASGKSDFIEPYFAWMRFALDGQMFDGDLLPFSTDETFRTAMAVAHGLPVDEQFEEGFYSANSSILWVAAAERLADMAQAIGRVDDADALRLRADTVRQACDEAFLAAEGYYHPYLYSADMTPAPAPFEDVNTKPIWSGYLSPDDPMAQDNLAATMALLEGQDGLLISPLHEIHKNLFGLPVAEGIHTGMSPGYFLENLALTQHPVAEAAFNALALHATASATTPEYQILDDHTPLHFLYDSAGAIGDYTARYRPWEGGILADAVWSYLLGNRPDALTNTLYLAPHLPNGWSWLEASGLRVGEARIDVRIEAVQGAWKVRFSNLGGTDSLNVELTLGLAAKSAACVSDGVPMACSVTPGHWDPATGTVTLPVTPLKGQDLTVLVTEE
jgi:hypothetical protein